MLFDVRAALAEILKQPDPAATPATPATKRPDADLVSRMSRVSQATIAKMQTNPFRNDGKDSSADHTPKEGKLPEGPEADVFPYGLSVTGNPRTWQGRIVSRDQWRQLTDLEWHGSTGKLWNGLTRQWEPDGGAA
jgi:hypothetical protein